MAPRNEDKLRQPSDLTEEEWSLVGPPIPPAKRRVVERIWAWLNRCRRLAKDFQTSAATPQPFSNLRQSARCCECSAIQHELSDVL
jgi:hypothetical protein